MSVMVFQKKSLAGEGRTLYTVLTLQSSQLVHVVNEYDSDIK